MKDKLVRLYKENSDFNLASKIILLWLASRILFYAVAVLYSAFSGEGASFTELMNQWDCKRYQYIVDNGYTFPMDTDPQANWAFFPVYSIVCVILKTITFGAVGTYQIGMFVSNICIIIAGFFAVKLLDNKKGAMLVPLLMFAGPYSFYFSGMMTESMFVMFIVLFFYFCRHRRYIPAGIMAAGASGTRIVGCILVFALLIEMYMDIVLKSDGEYGKDTLKISFAGIKSFIVSMIKTPKNIFAVMLCPLGIFSYMLYLYFFCGDGWAFKSVQIAWRDEPMFPIIGVLWKTCTGQIEPRYTYMGWACIFILSVYVYMLYRKYYSMAVFGLITLLIPLCSHVMSTCRFTVGTFVFYVGIEEIFNRIEAKKPCIKWLLLALLLAAEIVLLWNWYGASHWLF